MRELGIQATPETCSNKGRRTFQVLQVSANDRNILVPSPTMAHRNLKEMEDTFDKTFKIPENKDMSEKENAIGLRRSKRRNAFPQDKCQKVSSKEEIIVSKNPKLKSKAVKPKKAVKQSAKIEESVALNQSKMESYFSRSSQTSEDISESSTTIATPPPSGHEITFGIHKSVSDQTDMLTSATPDVNYWKDLAEERRVALEVALYENAQLCDHLQVLEAENGQLKSLIKECEKVISIVNDAVA